MRAAGYRGTHRRASRPVRWHGRPLAARSGVMQIMRPLEVHWETVERTTFDKMVSVLISRLHPSVQRIDGSGGDDGIDLLMYTDDGLVIYQLKSFTGRIDRSRRPKVERSLQSAAQHDPVEWRLVVPIDPTVAELRWFESLTVRYPFRCAWSGKCWLDSEMAQKPEIVNYYLHGGESQIIELLESVGAEHPLLGSGAVGASAQRVAEIVSRLNNVDPHYVFDITAPHDGAATVAIIPRYPGADRDRGRPPLSARFAFPDTEHGVDAQRSFQEFVDYGTPCTVPADYIAEMSLDVPAGLGATLDGYELSLDPAEPDPPGGIEAALQAVDAHGTVLAQLSLATTAGTRGQRGARLRFRDKSGALRVEAHFDIPDAGGGMRLHYQHPDVFSPLDLLPAAKFWYAATRADHFALLVNGQTVGRANGDTGSVPAAVEYLRFTEHLVHMQTATGVFFNVRGEATDDEARDIELASRLLAGEHITRNWKQLALNVTPAGREGIATALEEATGPGGAPVQDIKIGALLSICVQGHVIPVGRVVQQIASARVLSWTDTGEDAPHGTTTLTLVPAESDTVTMFLDGDQNDQPN